MKKTLLSAAILLCSLSSFAQDCTTILKTQNYGGRAMTSIKEPIKVQKNSNDGLVINLLYGSNLTVNIAATAKPYRCVNKNANMDVYFTDGTKKSITNMGDLNCEGNFAFFLGEAFQNTPVLEKLKSTKIKKIAITYTDSTNGKLKDTVEEFSFGDEQAKMFMQALSCLSNLKK